MASAPALQQIQLTRHSPGLMAGVVTCHAGALLALLIAPEVAEPITPPRPLSVSVIELQQEEPQPKPEIKPEPPRPLPPKPVVKPVPEPPLLSVEKLLQDQPPRAIPVPETKAVAEPIPEILPPPAPVVAEAPRPAPPPPPVIEPRFDADYLDNPKPPYPRLSSKLGESGKVFLRVLVKADGTVRELELHKSSGFERLDRSAMNTVQAWRFVPARQGSKSVDGWVIVPINFTFGS